VHKSAGIAGDILSLLRFSEPSDLAGPGGAQGERVVKFRRM
jgi:hypothetical protein